MEREIFSMLPVRTWRWLGVNESYLPEELQTPPVPVHKTHIDVLAGQKVTRVIANRTERQTEITARVAEGGTLQLVQLQMLPTDKAGTCSVTVRAEKDARIYYTAAEIGASHVLTQVKIELAGDGSQADVAALYFGDGARAIDLNYIIVQEGNKTEASMQVKGALQDSAVKIFRGTLDFKAGSKGSAGREKEEVVLLNEGIRNRSVPLMLSAEEDVNGQHAVSAGRLDKSRLFYLMSRGLDYLMSRGLDEKEARKLAVGALFATVLERVPDADLREEISREVEERIEHGQR